MTKRKLTIVRIALVAVLAMSVLFGLVACGSKVNGISIGRNDMPKLTYVEGQDLDLSAGKLTVDYGGKTETIPLDSDKVSVSGYDKTKAGKQTITVSYEGQTTEFEITLVARVRAENAQTVYYVGETLDTTRGRLLIANDDATTFNVPFSDSTVSFEGFDSSAPADSQRITAIYTNGATSYRGYFNVAIYSADEATLTAPRKTSYRSHEKFAVNGAYITFKHNGADEKQVAVTEDMISGVDFSLVTEANDESNPLVQNAKVVYGGREYPFTIRITYSNVTKLQKLLAEYDFKWTEPTVPEISDTVGGHAIDCMKIYLDLSVTEREYIEETARDAAARTAIAYAYKTWNDAFSALNGTVVIRDTKMLYVLSSYETAKRDAGIIADDTSAVNADIEFLNRMITVFEELTIGDVKTEDYLANISLYKNSKEEISKGITFLTDLSDALKNVPADWSDLAAYADDINAARDLIVNGDFGKTEYRDLLSMVSKWRKNDDFYDIIYSYYLAKEDKDSIEKLEDLVLPSKLNDVYMYLLNAIVEYSSITVKSEDGGYSTDSTFFVYYLREAMNAKKNALEAENDLYAELYYTLQFDNILADGKGESIPASFDDLFRFVAVSGYGYYDLVGGTLDDPELTALWNSYLKIVYDTSESEIALAMITFVEDFANLSPAQQKSFLLSVNVYYEGYDKFALDTDVGYTVLTRMLKVYYSEELTEDEMAMFRNLLLAIESYSGIGDKTTAAKDFLYYFGLVSEDYNATEYENFRNVFGAIYERYQEIANKYNANGELRESYTLNEEWRTVLNDLANEVSRIINASKIISPEEGDGENVFSRLYSSYETARKLAKKVLTEAPSSVKEYYYRVPVKFTDSISWTLDYAMSVQAMRIGVFYYAQITFGGNNLWEIIEESESLRSFFADSEAIVWTASDATETISVEQAAEIMKGYIGLSYRDKLIFSQLQAIQEGHEYYYEGLKAIFANAFKDAANVKAAAEALTEAEKAFTEYWGYTRYGSEENADQEELAAALAAARTAAANLETAIGALSETDAATFNGYFSEILEYYRNAANELPAERT